MKFQGAKWEMGSRSTLWQTTITILKRAAGDITVKTNHNVIIVKCGLGGDNSEYDCTQIPRALTLIWQRVRINGYLQIYPYSAICERLRTLANMNIVKSNAFYLHRISTFTTMPIHYVFADWFEFLSQQFTAVNSSSSSILRAGIGKATRL